MTERNNSDSNDRAGDSPRTFGDTAWATIRWLAAVPAIAICLAGAASAASAGIVYALAFVSVANAIGYILIVAPLLRRSPRRPNPRDQE